MAILIGFPSSATSESRQKRTFGLGADTMQASLCVRTLMMGAVVLLDRTRDFPAEHQHEQRTQRDWLYQPAGLAVDHPADAQHHKDTKADTDPNAVTDYPPVKGPRFGVPAAHHQRVGHWCRHDLPGCNSCHLRMPKQSDVLPHIVRTAPNAADPVVRGRVRIVTGVTISARTVRWSRPATTPSASKAICANLSELGFLVEVVPIVAEPFWIYPSQPALWMAGPPTVGMGTARCPWMVVSPLGQR